MREAKAENGVQNLSQQLRQQDVELCSKSQDCERSRHEQLLLLAELRNRERVHQETLTRMNKEVEELRNF